jgi:glycosyltransferase involved in cell wall biosynthesis
MSTVILCSGVVIWILYCLATIKAQRALEPIENYLENKHPNQLISIIMAVKDGEKRIGETLKQLINNGYQEIEIIVVNDRSTDNTSKIIEEYKKMDSRIREVKIEELPKGWLGKVHAQHNGALQARGEFILFTDADISISGDILRGAIGAFSQNQLDHLSILGHVKCPTFFLDVIVSTSRLLFTLSGRPWKKAHDCSASQVKGMGAFNMVRRSRYLSSPGLESFKMELADDVALAQMMRREGGVSKFYGSSTQGLSFTWYDDALEMMRGLEKNSVGGFTNYKFRLLLNVVATFSAALFPLSFVFLISTPIGASAYMVYFLSLLFLGVTLKNKAHTSFLALFFHPVGLFLLGAILLRAYILCIYRGGIQWGGSFYKLDDLRKGNQVKLGW